MSKTKSITELIAELQAENESAKSLVRLFNQACRDEFGYDVKTIHQIIEKQAAYERRRQEQPGQTIKIPQHSES